LWGVCRSLAQIGRDLVEGGSDRLRQAACCLFDRSANLFVLHGGHDRIGDPVPGSSQYAQGSLELLFGGAFITRHFAIARLQFVAQRCELASQTIPGVGVGVVDRIVFVFLHLLDGTYELFRAHFGFPNRTAPDGREVGATLGIIETTLALLREPGVTHVGVATDTVIESFRNDLFPGYKSSEGMEQALLDQFPLAERAIEILGLTCWKMREFEADDAIATAAFRFCEDVEQVVICTPDKDLAQCVLGDRIVTLNRRQQSIMDEAGVWEKFGVGPESIPDYLALVGDTADGVPGLPGWGAKSAAAVLARFRKLEAIPTDPADWGVSPRGAVKLAATLAEHRNLAMAYRTLTTLRRDVPLPESLEDLRWHGVDQPTFLELCDELGFDDIRTRPHRWREG